MLVLKFVVVVVFKFDRYRSFLIENWLKGVVRLMRSWLFFFEIIYFDIELCIVIFCFVGLGCCAVSIKGRRGVYWFIVRDVGGVEGLVREIIFWIVSLSFKRCRGLLILIFFWILVFDNVDMMVLFFTLVLYVVTY